MLVPESTSGIFAQAVVGRPFVASLGVLRRRRSPVTTNVPWHENV